ncbi:hypothetical protein [Aureivirga sp. CE67]|uniref:hypothetical protein n=1 Tax=Aureivirga sp. CE67 TaxID=1788983 RepID=UPI0018CA5D2E|nr:hypothetical protein [Aureivirga sp. CE67]
MEKEKILNLLWHLQNRRNMYVLGDSYESLENFLIGYFIGIKEFSKKDYLVEFSEWLKIKENDSFSVFPTGYILNVLSDGNSDIAEKKLFILLEEFFKTQ